MPNRRRLVPLLLVPLLACKATLGGPLDAEVTVDPKIATVVHVAWEMPEAATAWIEYGPTDAYGAETPPADLEAGPASVTVLGLRADATWHWRLRLRDGDREWIGEDGTFTTGELPGELPEVDVGNTRRAPARFVVTSAVVSTDEVAAAALVLDATGAVVWYWTSPEGRVPAARPSLDGTAVLVLVEGEDGADSAIVRVPFDGSDETWFEAPDAHHDFQELPDGTLAWIATTLRDVRGEDIVGDRVLERSPDGETRTAWDAFATLPVEENDGWNSAYYGGLPDWTHGNGLAWDEEDDAWLVSLYSTESVVKADRATGVLVWELGGSRSDFTFVGDEGFGPQHAPVPVDGGILLFDNGGDSASRVVQYALDVDARTATPSYSWADPEGARTFVMGGARPFAGGVSLSGWGDAGDVLAVDEEGDVVWRVAMEPGTVVGRVTGVETLYP